MNFMNIGLKKHLKANKLGKEIVVWMLKLIKMKGLMLCVLL